MALVHAGIVSKRLLALVVVVALLPARIVAQTLAELIAFLACLLVGTLAGDVRPIPRPLCVIVRAIVPPACRVVLWSVGMWNISVTGRRAQAQLYVCNHASIIDGFVLTTLLGAPAFVARKEGLSRLPIYGTIVRAMQLVFVDRGSASSRSEAARELMDRLGSTDDWPPLVVFPEGTTNGGSRELLPFRTGAFRAPVPCQPVLVTYPGTELPGQGESSAIAELKLIARLMLTLRTQCHVELLPLHVPSADECTDANRYATAVRARMQARLGTVSPTGRASAPSASPAGPLSSPVTRRRRAEG